MTGSLEQRFAETLTYAPAQPLGPAWTPGAIVGIQRWRFFLHVITASVLRGDRYHHAGATCERCDLAASSRGFRA